jgi:two-component system, OmpR family, response regulator
MTGAARILVVDDDVAARETLVHTLHERGYRSTPADPAAAPDVAETFRPDLVVLEMVGSRGVVGDKIAHSLRAQSDPLLVFVSREHCTATRLLAFDAGADDYVTKPYEVEELLARLRAVLRRSGRLGHAVSHVGRLLVDERAHQVQFDGEDVELGPTDFDLLAVLARHAGQVMTKSRLLELVWGYESYDENLVVVRVSLLRRRLGPTAGRLIRTLRGVGYVLSDNGVDAGRLG